MAASIQSSLTLQPSILAHSDSGCRGYFKYLYGPAQPGDPTPVGALSQTHFTLDCATVANIPAAENTVYLKHYYRWKNVSSRLLGPGTTFSVTYGWLTGVDSTIGSEMGTSVDNSRTSQESISATVGAEAGVNVGIVEAKVSASLTVGGTFTQMMNETFSATITRSTQFSAQKSGSQTESVTGADNADRVYTVWQLMEEFVYADSVSGEEITVATIRSTSGFVAGALPQSSWRPISIRWPQAGVMEQGTQTFAQQTTDFPRGSAAVARTSVRLIQVPEVQR